MLQRHIEVRQDQAFGHQRQQVVDMRVGVDVVQSRPGRQLPEFTRQRGQSVANGRPARNRCDT